MKYKMHSVGWVDICVYPDACELDQGLVNSVFCTACKLRIIFMFLKG